MQLGEKRSLGKWWLCAGFSGLLFTSAFIAATLYLGSRDPALRPRFRHVSSRATVKPTPTSTPADRLELGPDPMTYEELYPLKRNPVKKKSEAVYPADWPREMARPVVVDPQDIGDDFSLPGIQPQPPPFRYIKDYEDSEVEYENPMFTYLQKRLKDIYDLVGSRKAVNADWLDLLRTVNESIYKSNATIIMEKLKTMYYNTSAPEIPMSSLIYPNRQTLLSNSSSLVSFGLLAIDLFLLHNVQQIAFTEEDALGDRLQKDPEVVALNALFLPPDRLGKSSRSREELESQGMIQEVLEFLLGVMRAVGNLGKAYAKSTSPEEKRSNEPSPLDCIWTLYCRNLDKTAKLDGPYGFLAKMNSLGLRLMMGEFPVEQALEKLFTEFTRGWGHLNCHKLFPRCSADEARHVVMETALGDNRI
ncbi:uncharacterized protein LOC106666137 [Cimex lectularius]|uniref:Uncharacterized protein n=1 Tax=Cimex lectularius TaxID=79782 RepID=A0A8I6RR20_CIMLE|nr:uncharacterized protein LOC106666137 [Cimex lectularius]